MEWIHSMQKAINYIEENLLDDIDPEQIAKNIYSSSANFQRIFSITTGITVGDYIRYRRLSLAGKEITNFKGGNKIIYIAMKYRYETAESFTKAFIRFHGITPSAAKKHTSGIKYFAPFSIKIDIKGGFNMQRKIIPNIPLLEYHGNNAAYFAYILDAALQGMGEPSDLARIAAYSGESNRLCWTEGVWKFGNECMEMLNEIPFEIENRTISYLGWKAKYFIILRDKDGNLLNTDAVQLRREFVDAIDRGVPIIPAWNRFQPGYTVFFGYEDDGQKMVGWDYSDNGTESISWENWEREINGYILLQEKLESKPEREIAIDLFNLITRRARRKDEINGRKVGIAAWESFLNLLENDDLSSSELDTPPVDGIAKGVSHRFIVYCDCLCQIEARIRALPYYRVLAERFPEWREELETAANALESCGLYGGFLWGQGFSFDEKGFEKFRDPVARKTLADAGRDAMKNDIKAVEQFEKILQKERR